jgi:serine/threonine protein kinase
VTEPVSDRTLEHLTQMLEAPDPVDGRYEVIELLGRGGMGAVYRVRDIVLDREVAMKVLNHSSGYDQPEGRERLQREARVLARLEHPGIVPVYDAGSLSDGRVYYVMRLVKGHRLDEYAARNPARGPLMRQFLRICEAVAFAHENGVVHRDLKPGNVMIGPLGEVLVLDWGVAKLRVGAAEAAVAEGSPAETADARTTAARTTHARTTREREGASAERSLTSDGTVVGTPGFMAPEQASGMAAAADERADIHGLGAILREMISVAPAPDTYPHPAPRALASIVKRATAPKPADRYPTALALAQDVQRWMDGQLVSAHRESTVERLARIYNRHQTAILLLLGYALVRILIFLFRGV